MRFRLLRVAALAVLVLAASAREEGAGLTLAVVKAQAFLPALFHAGEEVEAVLQVGLDGPEVQPFDARAGEGLPAASSRADPEVRSVRLQKSPSGWELRLRFVPWSPGPGSIPPMTIRGLALPPLAYETASILGQGERDPAPPKAQLEPPGTALYLYGFLGALILLGLLVLAGAAWLIPGARRLIARSRAAQARRNLGRSLSWLGREVGRARPEDFYAVLSRAFRTYLGARVLPEAPALTPRELGARPEGAFPLPGLRDEAAALLAEADAVRFGGLDVGAEGMRGSLAVAEKLGDSIEEALGDGL